MTESPVARTNKNWLLVKFRQWHSWGGLFLSVFILIVAVTGILLNHKDLFLHGKTEKKEKASGLLTASTDFSTIPVSFVAALQLARGHFGDVPLEKIELKDERGWLVYKVIKGEGDEIRIDAHTGEMSSKYGMRLAAGKSERMSEGKSTAKRSGLNWAKIVDDLHTGKIVGTPGKLVVDLTSGVIIALTLSGIYLWGVPFLRKRRSAREREANPVRMPAPMPSRFRAPAPLATAATATEMREPAVREPAVREPAVREPVVREPAKVI